MADAFNTKIEDMFGGKKEDVNLKIEEMATFITIEDEEIKTAQAKINERKANLDQLKAELSMFMKLNGFEKVSLTNGLTPKTTTTRKYYKQAGVTDEQLFEWLKNNDLGDIIKPSVHFQTMQSTLKNFVGEIPEEVFNVSDVPSVTMYGKSKFLANREQNTPTP